MWNITDEAFHAACFKCGMQICHKFYKYQIETSVQKCCLLTSCFYWNILAQWVILSALPGYKIIDLIIKCVGSLQWYINSVCIVLSYVCCWFRAEKLHVWKKYKLQWIQRWQHIYTSIYAWLVIGRCSKN